MIKTIVFFLALSSVGLCSIPSVYKETDSSAWVEDVHYDSDLNVIVLHIHAEICFLNIDRIYGIKVKNNRDIDNRLKEVMGDSPKIVRLEEK